MGKSRLGFKLWFESLWRFDLHHKDSVWTDVIWLTNSKEIPFEKYLNPDKSQGYLLTDFFKCISKQTVTWNLNSHFCNTGGVRPSWNNSVARRTTICLPFCMILEGGRGVWKNGNSSTSSSNLSVLGNFYTESPHSEKEWIITKIRSKLWVTSNFHRHLSIPVSLASVENLRGFTYGALIRARRARLTARIVEALLLYMQFNADCWVTAVTDSSWQCMAGMNSCKNIRILWTRLFANKLLYGIVV